MQRVVTVVLNPDGSLRLASEGVSTGDAERWAEDGKQVFRLATGRRGQWAVNHVNSGAVLTDKDWEGTTLEPKSSLALLLTHRPTKEG